jgi:hypothetical protein
MKTTGNWKLSQAAGALALALSLFAFGSCSNMLTELRPISQVEAAKAELDESMIQLSIWDRSLAAGVSGDFFLPSEVRGVTIVWTVDDPATITLDGTVARVMQPGEEATRTVTATFTRYGVSVTKTFQVAVKPAPAEGVAGDAEAVAAVTALLTAAEAAGTTAALAPILGLASGDSPLAVTRPLALPTSGPGGTTIVWSSSNPAVISPDGTVLRPSSDTDDTEVILTATVYRNGVASDTPVSFPVTVSAGPADDPAGHRAAVAADASGLRPLIGQGQTLDHITGDLGLPAFGAAGSTISWTATPAGIMDGQGRLSRPSVTTTVMLTAEVMKGDEKRVVTVPLTVLAAPQTPGSRVASDLRFALPGTAPGDSLGRITRTLGLPTTGPAGSTISWAASPEGVIDPSTGAVTRPVSGSSDVTLTATIQSGSGQNMVTMTRTISVSVAAPPLSDEEAVAGDLAAVRPVLTGSDSFSSLTASLVLPTTGPSGTTIRWQSSHPGIVAVDGRLVRSSALPTQVTLTATLSRGFAQERSRSFTLVVAGLPMSDQEATNGDADSLAIRFPDSSDATNVLGPLELPAAGVYGTTVRWSSDKPGIIGADGTVNRPLGEPATVVLEAEVRKGNATTTRSFSLTVPARPGDDSGRVEADASALVIRYAPGNDAGNVTGALVLPGVGPSGSTIRWSSGAPGIVKSDGSVVRPLYADEMVTLVATLSAGGATRTESIGLLVRKQPTRAAEAVLEDAFTLGPVFGSGDTLFGVRATLGLPLAGPCGTSISWTSDNPALVSGTGLVRRPAQDTPVVLTATVVKNGQRVTKVFELTVKAAEAGPAETVAADAALLQLVFAGGDSPGNVTGNLVLPQTGANGSRIRWTSGTVAIIRNDGSVFRPADADREVTLVATIEGGDDPVVMETRTFVVLVRRAPLDDAAITQADAATVAPVYTSGDSPTSVSTNLQLPELGSAGSTIRWTANPSGIIGTGADYSLGTLVRPGTDTVVVLTAIIEKGGSLVSKTFTVKVLGVPEDAAASVIADTGSLAVGLSPGDTLSGVTGTVRLPDTGPSGTSITWAANPGGIILTAPGSLGLVSRPEQDTVVILTATISKGDPPQTETKEIRVLVKAREAVPADALAADLAALAIGFGGGDNPSFVASNLVLPALGQNGSAVNWQSSDAGTITIGGSVAGGVAGIVNRPAFGSADEFVDLTATLTYPGGLTDTKVFRLRVRQAAPTPAQAVAADADEHAVLASVVFGPGDDKNNVTTGFTLPGTGQNGSTYNWGILPVEGPICYHPGHSDIPVLSYDPAPGESIRVVILAPPEEDTPVTIDGTVSSGEVSQPTSVTVKVKKGNSQGNLGITISFTLPTDPVFGLPEGPIELDRRASTPETITLSAATGFADYVWLIDGVRRLQGPASSFVVNSAGLTVGPHYVQVEVLKDGRYYRSPAKSFQVIER